jgi:hypothetical protein
MNTTPREITERTRSIDQRLQSQLRRCEELDAEARALTCETKNIDSMTRGLFVADLINEARSKLVECQIVAGSISQKGDLAVAHLAISERWVTSAIDLLNRAQLVLDFRQDIFGKTLPTGGLWDK